MPMVSLKLMAGAAIRMVVWVSRCLWRTPRISIFEGRGLGALHFTGRKTRIQLMTLSQKPGGKWENLSRNAS